MLHRLRAIAKRKQEQRRERIAYKLWLRRQRLNRPGNQDDDWDKAGKIARSRVRRTLFNLNSPLIWMEKTWFEPTDSLLTRAAFFDIFNRLSFLLEAVGIVLIPIWLFRATQEIENSRDARELERLQQESIEDYIGQITEVLLSVNGDLRSDNNERVRNVLTAATLTRLRDPNLDGERKGQIIEFLTATKLVQGEQQDNGTLTKPLVSLRGTNLNDAELSGADLYGADLYNSGLYNADLTAADLRNADLSIAILPSADLHKADLSDADLTATNLRKADLSDADLRNADLLSADFHDADLRNADLRESFLYNADFINADLYSANLSKANLSDADLRDADLRDANFRKANLIYTSLHNTDLSDASLSGADLNRASLRRSILLGTDLNTAQNLSPNQLTGANQPYLCGTRLPLSITNVDSNRDCDEIPKILINRYDDLSLEEAKKSVEIAKNKKWS